MNEKEQIEKVETRLQQILWDVKYVVESELGGNSIEWGLEQIRSITQLAILHPDQSRVSFKDKDIREIAHNSTGKTFVDKVEKYYANFKRVIKEEVDEPD